MILWFLALLGILTSFFIKYSKRTNKEKEWSFTYWIKDNWAELSASFTATIILVIIFQNTTFNNSFFSEHFKWITSLPIGMIASAAAGYFGNTLLYAMIKKLKG